MTTSEERDLTQSRLDTPHPDEFGSSRKGILLPAMTEILQFLAGQLSFLYSKYGFRITDSMVSDSFGGDAYLVIEREELRIRLVRDRSQYFIELQSTQKSQSNSWFTVDLLRGLMGLPSDDNAFMTNENAQFLETHLDAILSEFRDSKITSRLNAEESKRSKRRTAERKKRKTSE